MAATDINSANLPNKLPEPDDPQFAPIRADLARLYMRHRLDLGLPLASNECIVANTNSITMGLWLLSKHALDHKDEAWLTRHRWWVQSRPHSGGYSSGYSPQDSKRNNPTK